MTDIPRPAPGDTDWIDWADEQEASSDVTRDGISVAELSATGTRDANTFLRGDNTWATPPTGSGTGAVDSVNGEVGAVVLDAADVGAAPSSHTHTAAQVGAVQAVTAGLKAQVITQAAYDALATKDATTLYLIQG